MDVRFLRGRERSEAELYLQGRFISGNSRPDQVGPGEERRLACFPLVKIEFITIDKENL